MGHGNEGPTPGPSGPGRRANQGTSGADAAGIGVQFAATLVLFTFAGIWVDRRLDSSPWFTILLLFVGAGAAFYSIYRKLVIDKREPPAGRPGEGPR